MLRQPLQSPLGTGCRALNTNQNPAQSGTPFSSNRLIPVRRRRLASTGPTLLAVLLLMAGIPPLPAQSLLDEETRQLLVAAVEAAAELDLYYARCRRDLSGRRTDNLNQELASKFRLTVLEVEDSLFPERSYRRVEERLQREFSTKLKQSGGCKGAKQAGMPNRLRAHYDDLIGSLEQLP